MSQNDQLFHLLKQQVLTRAGISPILPRGCKVLANQIYAQTKLFLSETTLKRIYGFAQSRFEASFFTKNALACFCGYQGWQDYTGHMQAKEDQPADTTSAPLSWPQIRINAHRVTQAVLKTQQNRLAEPYQSVICRSSLKEHLHDFDHSGYRTTVICDPLIVGKAGAIGQELRDRMVDILTDDIYLLLPNAVLDAGVRDWLGLYASVQQMIGFRHPDESRPLALPMAGHHFYLVIDRPEDAYDQQAQFGALVEQINALCQLHQGCNWFKLILLIRPDTWIRHKPVFEAGPVKWFLGNLAKKLN